MTPETNEHPKNKLLSILKVIMLLNKYTQLKILTIGKNTKENKDK